MSCYLSIRNRNAITYFYVVNNIWDKEQKKIFKQQTYLGRYRKNQMELNEKGLMHAELFKGSKFEREYWNWRESYEASCNREQITTIEKVQNAEQKCAGINLLFSKISADIGLRDALETVFGMELASKIESLAYYCASQGRYPLYQASLWTEEQFLPYRAKLSEAEISAILKKITSSEILQFLGLWSKGVNPKELLNLDITSTSSYSKCIEDVVFGYNRDLEKLPQINLLLVSSQRSGLPVWYEQLPGAIIDSTALQDTLKLMSQSKCPCKNYVMDRGFATHANIEYMLKNHIKFTMGIPLHLFPEYLRECQEAQKKNLFCDPQSTLSLFEEFDTLQTQAVTLTKKIAGHRVYCHLFYTDAYHSLANEALMSDLVIVKEKLLAKKILNKDEKFLAEQCFIVKETPVRGIKVTANLEQIAKLRDNSSGFFVVLSSQFKDPNDALNTYKLRDHVEKGFDDLKNEEDAYRLRVHSAHAMRSRLFLQFIAQILRSYTLKKIQNAAKKPHKVKCLNDCLQNISSLKKVKIEGHRAFYKRPTKVQLAIMDLFGIDRSGPEWNTVRTSLEARGGYTK